LTKIIYVEVKVPERISDVILAEVVGLGAVEVGLGLGAPLEGGLAL
jgi:hypothetical protein